MNTLTRIAVFLVVSCFLPFNGYAFASADEPIATAHITSSNVHLYKTGYSSIWQAYKNDCGKINTWSQFFQKLRELNTNIPRPYILKQGTVVYVPQALGCALPTPTSAEKSPDPTTISVVQENPVQATPLEITSTIETKLEEELSSKNLPVVFWMTLLCIVLTLLACITTMIVIGKVREIKNLKQKIRQLEQKPNPPRNDYDTKAMLYEQKRHNARLRLENEVFLKQLEGLQQSRRAEKEQVYHALLCDSVTHDGYYPATVEQPS